MNREKIIKLKIKENKLILKVINTKSMKLKS